VSDLSDARSRWLAEESKYDKLQKRVVAILKKQTRSQGIVPLVISGRAKGMPNLLKKILKKGYSYDRITDKAGARIVVRFRHEVEPALRLVESSFDILSKEDKFDTLGHDKVGYSGVHYGVRLAQAEPEEADVRGLQCEIQIHTLCQSLWAEMAHEMSYKPAQPLPEDLLRQVHLLNAQLEIADRSFDAISKETMQLPRAFAMGLLQSLERHFYRFTGERFDSELSLQILDDILMSYDPDDRSRVAFIIEDFVESNSTKLQSIFTDYENIADRPLLLFQPESLVLFERLDRSPHTLEEVWVQRYPREELERLGIAWSKPLD
jgi:ppGpp synthetase/RelA/SpoT-type nucleotidyltranferase